jgi:hypothetical protein
VKSDVPQDTPLENGTQKTTMPSNSSHLPANTKENGISIRSERERIARLSRIRQLIFGLLDGLLVHLGSLVASLGAPETRKR